MNATMPRILPLKKMVMFDVLLVNASPITTTKMKTHLTIRIIRKVTIPRPRDILRMITLPPTVHRSLKHLLMSMNYSIAMILQISHYINCCRLNNSYLSSVMYHLIELDDFCIFFIVFTLTCIFNQSQDYSFKIIFLFKSRVLSICK